MLFSVPTPTEHLYNSCITVFVYSKLQKVLVSSPMLACCYGILNGSTELGPIVAFLW